MSRSNWLQVMYIPEYSDQNAGYMSSIRHQPARLAWMLAVHLKRHRFWGPRTQVTVRRCAGAVYATLAAAAACT